MLGSLVSICNLDKCSFNWDARIIHHLAECPSKIINILNRVQLGKIDACTAKDIISCSTMRGRGNTCRSATGPLVRMFRIARGIER